MAAASQKVLSLHPVVFRYKQPYSDGTKPIQFGLVAEEVAATFPELAVFNQDGEPESVKYHVLPSLLLNEVIEQSKKIDQQDQQIKKLQNQVEMLLASIGK